MSGREPRHAADPYAQFYDEAAQETAAWLNGAEWAREPEEREQACACGDMDLCPTCRGAMCCEVGRQDCGDEMHCAGGCWTNCRTCVADAGSGTR